MASSYTTNYNLDKYVGTDKPNLRDQYNAAMDKIDNALLAANTNATEAKAATLSFQDDIDGLQAQIGSGYSSSSTVKDAIAAVSTSVSSEASARQTADTNLASDIASNTSAISAEVSARQTAVSNEATARHNADENLQTSINLIMGKPLFVIVGDSWVDQNVILQTISQKLQVDIANYGYGGTGWNRTNGNTTNHGNFAQQLAYAASQMSENDKKRTVGILVIGGVNDLSYHNFNIADTKAAINTGAAALVENRNTYFPKVPIYAAFNTQSYKYQNNPTYTAKMNRIASDFTQDFSIPLAGIIPLQNVFYSYLYGANGFDSTNLHLNDIGAEQYGNAIAQAINSGYTAEWFWKETGPRATTNSGITFEYIEYMFKNGYYSICPKIIKFSGISGGQSGTFKIPPTGGSWMFAIPWIAPNSRWDATPVLFADFTASAWIKFSMNDANNSGPSLSASKELPSGSTTQASYNAVRLGSDIIWHD